VVLNRPLGDASPSQVQGGLHSNRYSGKRRYEKHEDRRDIYRTTTAESWICRLDPPMARHVVKSIQEELSALGRQVHISSHCTVYEV
jgi:hypothetical protein